MNAPVGPPLPRALKLPLINGLAYYPRAWRLLAQRRELWGYFVAPLVLNAIVGSLLTVAGIVAGWQLVDRAMVLLPDWAAFAGPVLHVLFSGLALFVVALLVGRVGVVLGAPWYATLSERIEESVLGRDMPGGAKGPFGWLVDIWRAVAFETLKLGCVIAAALLGLGVAWIPLVGPMLNVAVGLLMLSFFACLDAFDPSLERRQLSFSRKVRLVLARPTLSLGFGAPAALLAGIPFLNLLAYPFLVAAGTLICCDQEQLGRQGEAASP